MVTAVLREVRVELAEVEALIRERVDTGVPMSTELACAVDARLTVLQRVEAMLTVATS
jgi:hypothetical protein